MPKCLPRQLAERPRRGGRGHHDDRRHHHDQLTQPAVVTVQRTLPEASVRLFGWTVRLSQESRLLVVAVAGALGGMVHALRSLFWYTGNRRLVLSWLLMYCLLPFVGAVLALIVYLVIRGGFVTGFGPTAEVSPYGAAATAALVGAFSENAAAKLRQVSATLLTAAEQGTDHAPPNLPDIKAFKPNRGPAGARITITGSGLAGASSVHFVGSPAATPTVISDTAITVAVPAGAQSGPITIVTPAGAATSTGYLVVD